MLESTWECIAIDLLGPFVSSLERKNKFCLTVIDHFSNYLVLIPLPSPARTGPNAAQYRQTSPGDDALTVRLTPTSSAVAIGILGTLYSNFSILVSAPSTEVPRHAARGLA